jgi:tetratricopeptide (TPR) repeat protein
MFPVPIRHGRYNSVCGSLSKLMARCNLRCKRTLTLITALAVGWIVSGPTAGATGGGTGEPAPQVRPASNQTCPPPLELDGALGQASTLMQQSRFQDAAGLLQPLAGMNCDARVSLLLAAALEGESDEPQAISALARAHSVWPSNNSIAASLARAYLAIGKKDQAANALARFHGTAETPEQELEMAVVVYLAANQLVSAQKLAEQDYKYYPSVHSLLLLANALQMQGRYPDVNRILGEQRGIYADSPEFLVTLAESEFDASILPAARDDLKRAISLNPRMYQAHYLLGNVFAKMHDSDSAIAEYHLAIDLAPDQPRTYYQLAMVLFSMQDYAGEQQALEQALAADNTYAPAHSELGKILLEDHRPAEAVTHLLLAIQYNPRSEEAYFLLARSYAALGEKEKSEEMVKRLKAVRAENRPGPNKGIGGGSADQAASQ